MIIATLKTMLLFWGSITISNGDLFVSDSETFYIDFTNIDEYGTTNRKKGLFPNQKIGGALFSK